MSPRKALFIASVIFSTTAASNAAAQDSIPYWIFSRFFDADKLFAQAGIRTESCTFTHIKETEFKPFIPLTKSLEYKKSNHLGSCLFENALASAGSDHPVGYVRANMRFAGDTASDPSTEIFIRWKPSQAFVPPNDIRDFDFHSSEGQQFLRDNAITQATWWLGQYLRNDIEIRPLKPLSFKHLSPLGRENELVDRVVIHMKPYLTGHEAIWDKPWKQSNAPRKAWRLEAEVQIFRPGDTVPFRTLALRDDWTLWNQKGLLPVKNPSLEIGTVSREEEVLWEH